MGDRYDRNQRKVAHPALRGLKPPSEILDLGPVVAGPHRPQPGPAPR